MNKQKQLAKNAIILTVGRICTQCVSFFLLPLYTAILSPAEYGVVDLFNTYISLLLPVVNWQFDMGLFRFLLDCRNNKESQKKKISTVINTNLLQAIGYLIIFAIVQNFITSPFKIFLAIDVVLNIFTATLLQISRGFGKNGVYSFASFLSASTLVVFNVLFVAVFRMGAYGLFISGVLAKLITIGYLFVKTHVWGYYSIHHFSKKEFKCIAKYSLPLIPNSLSWWVLGVSDRTIISATLGVIANGIYSVANKFSSIFITFYNIFNVAWMESVSLHIDDEDRDEFLSDTITTLFSLFSAVCIGIIAVMPFVFPVMINEKYTGAYNQIPILMVAVLCQVVVGLYSVVYTAKKLSGEIAKTSFAAAIINIFVDVVLIRYIGLYAASISTLAAYGLMMIYRYFDTKKYVKIVISKKLFFSTMVVLLGVMAAYYVNNLYLNISALIVAVCYAVAINRNMIKSVWLTVRQAINRINKRLNDNKMGE